MSDRVGLGWDIHRLEPGEGFRLGGVFVDAPFEVQGHSDADAALHAVIDAVLGGAGLGDIGKHFPPEDPKWKDVNSLELLRRSLELVHSKKLRVVNLDVVVTLEATKLTPYRAEMNNTLHSTVPKSEQVNLKFKTAEGLGPAGREEAVEARAVALLTEIDEEE